MFSSSRHFARNRSHETNVEDWVCVCAAVCHCHRDYLWNWRENDMSIEQQRPQSYASHKSSAAKHQHTHSLARSHEMKPTIYVRAQQRLLERCVVIFPDGILFNANFAIFCETGFPHTHPRSLRSASHQPKHVSGRPEGGKFYRWPCSQADATCWVDEMNPFVVLHMITFFIGCLCPVRTRTKRQIKSENNEENGKLRAKRQIDVFRVTWAGDFQWLGCCMSLKNIVLSRSVKLI